MLSATRPRRLLAVCLGNHCRSPLAAAVLTARGGPAVDVRSAGIRDKWAGHPAHAQMVTAAASAGYDLTAHRGVHISPALLEWADAVLAMDRANLAALRDLGGQVTAGKFGLYLGDRDIPDPWGKSPEDFDAVVALIEDGALRHLS